MILMGVNALVYVQREDVKNHRAYRKWMESVLNPNIAYGFSELVLSGFIRVAIHLKVFEKPSSLEVAIAFVQQSSSAEHAMCLAPGRNH
jgi:predicted nucleic acid-binding protein